MRLVAVLGLIVGLAVATLLVVAYGLGDVGAALLAVGWSGFLVFCLVHAAFIAILGLAWWVLAPGAGPATFIWARLIRDAGSDVLPLSQIGGYAMGARAAALRGVPGRVAVATTVVDVTLELLAQLVFTALGLAVFVLLRPESPLILPMALGLAVAAALAGGFIAAQRRGLAAFERVAGRGLATIGASAAAVHEAIIATYRNRRGLLLGLLLHLVEWVGGRIESWLALYFMGTPLGLAEILAIESLVYAMRAVAFLVPNAIGVQEGAYVALGATFGLTPETALALSLLRRVRDLVFGAPALLAWQLAEGRRALGARSA